MAGILHPQAREIAQLLFLFLLQARPIINATSLGLKKEDRIDLNLNADHKER